MQAQKSSCERSEHAGVRASRARGTLRVPGPLKAAKNPGGGSHRYLGIPLARFRMQPEQPTTIQRVNRTFLTLLIGR